MLQKVSVQYPDGQKLHLNYTNIVIQRLRCYDYQAIIVVKLGLDPGFNRNEVHLFFIVSLSA